MHPLRPSLWSSSSQRPTLYLESKSSAPCGRFSEMKAGIAKERIARLLRFPGWESRTLPDSDTRNPAHIRRGAPTIHEKSRPFYTSDGFLHIRVILKRDTERARREAGISRPSCAGSRAARSGRRRRPPEASTARAGFHRRSEAERTQTARRNRKSRCRPLHP